MQCIYCNNEIDKDAVVCCSCGRPVEGKGDTLTTEYDITTFTEEVSDDNSNTEVLGLTETMTIISSTQELEQFNKAKTMELTGSVPVMDNETKPEKLPEDQNYTQRKKNFIIIAAGVLVIIVALVIVVNLF